MLNNRKWVKRIGAVVLEIHRNDICGIKHNSSGSYFVMALFPG